MEKKHEGYQQLPHHPLQVETIKLTTEKGEKVFPVRHLSKSGLALDLLELGDEQLFLEKEYQGEFHTEGTACKLVLKIDERRSHCAHFSFIRPNPQIEKAMDFLLNPARIGKSLKHVPVGIIPEASGMSYWYHGAMASDLFVWGEIEKGISHALLCWNSFFLEWTPNQEHQTGTSVKSKEDRISLQYHDSPLHHIIYEGKKILEKAHSVDSRLVEFLLAQE